MSYDDNNLAAIKMECPIGIVIQLNLEHPVGQTAVV